MQRQELPHVGNAWLARAAFATYRVPSAFIRWFIDHTLPSATHWLNEEGSRSFCRPRSLSRLASTARRLQQRTTDAYTHDKCDA